MMSDRVVIAGIFLFGFATENFFLMACAVICVTLGVVQSLIRMRNITRFYALDEDLKRISKQIQKIEKEAVG